MIISNLFVECKDIPAQPLITEGGAMNVKLVESLVQIIDSLTPEEQSLLDEKLKHQKFHQEEQLKRENLRTKIKDSLEGQVFDPPLEDYIQITRDERTTQQDEWLRSCFEKTSKS